MVQVDGMVGAGCQEDLGCGVLKGEVRAGRDGAGRLREGQGAVRGEF